jgi:hypothetical protein
MTTAQAAVSDRYTQTVGGRGVLGRVGRMIVMICTFGFVFPNAFIEGMNPTEIDRKFWTDN